MAAALKDSVVFRDSNQDDIQKGDVLRFERGWFDHYAVYIGGQEVVHQTADQGVIIQNLVDVIGESDFYIDRNTSTIMSDEVRLRTIKRALSRVGRQGYHLLTSNCEHFATWCRDGVARSEQVRDKFNQCALSVSNAISSSGSSSRSSSSKSSTSSSSGTSSRTSADSMGSSRDKICDKFCDGCMSLSKAKKQ